MHITSWRNSRVLITGSSGFVGRHLMSFFRAQNAITLGITRHPVHKESENVVDASNLSSLHRVVKDFRPHAVFHLASEAVVEAGQTHPYETFHNNIVSTLNVLESCRMLSVPRIIIASTVHVYGDAPLPYREDEAARPSRPYETSKTASDLIAQSYADSYNLPVLIPRFANIYGPGDTNATRIVPKTIQAIMRGEQPTLWDGRARRDYLYIDDAIHAYDLLGKITEQQMERNRIYNFATGTSVTAKKLMEMIIAIMKKDVKIKRIPPPRTREITRQKVVWTKAKRILGWSPMTDLVAGLSKTIEWYSRSL